MSETTQEKVFRLNTERPDLIPLLRRLLASDDGPHKNERQEDLDELTRRGLLVKLEPGRL
jgi:hypothetical protein